ncbi:hypothetical protein CFC21_092367 [Triticum aestivum]|uniref:Uncharacterized protein n=3 Tax=Triticinae TaxID=1648030 RepID=A0A453NPE1_AEGTS|nr:hypothetical protein CFC21_092367 [Triticum aestivum]
MASLRVVITVVLLLLCACALLAECSRPLRDHAHGGGGLSTANLPVFVVARAGPSRRGAGH